jgi:hypothetical protein
VPHVAQHVARAADRAHQPDAGHPREVVRVECAHPTRPDHCDAELAIAGGDGGELVSEPVQAPRLGCHRWAEQRGAAGDGPRVRPCAQLAYAVVAEVYIIGGYLVLRRVPSPIKYYS